MENANNMWLFSLITTRERSLEFLKILFTSSKLPKLATMLTTDLNFFVRIVTNIVGSEHVMRMFGISEEINIILFHAIVERYTDLMTNVYGSDVALRALQVCNPKQKSIFLSATVDTTYFLAHSDIGPSSLERVITLADDFYKEYFLEAIAMYASSIHKKNSGIRLALHVLELDYTQKTTPATPRLHLVADEFLTARKDEAELLKFCSKLTSDRDLFVDFVKTSRGSLSVQAALFNVEEIDNMFLKAIDETLPDIVTHRFGLQIMLRIVDVFKKRGNTKVAGQINRRIASNVLNLTMNYRGNRLLESVIESNDVDCILLMVSKLISHVVKFSFEKLGSNVLEKLLSVGESIFALGVIVKEFVACDEETLVMLAKDEFGNKVLKKALEFAKERRRVYLFGKLVGKLKPLVHLLRGTQGDNIAAIIDS